MVVLESKDHVERGSEKSAVALSGFSSKLFFNRAYKTTGFTWFLPSLFYLKASCMEFSIYDIYLWRT